MLKKGLINILCSLFQQQHHFSKFLISYYCWCCLFMFCSIIPNVFATVRDVTLRPRFFHQARGIGPHRATSGPAGLRMHCARAKIAPILHLAASTGTFSLLPPRKRDVASVQTASHELYHKFENASEKCHRVVIENFFFLIKSRFLINHQIMFCYQQ